MTRSPYLLLLLALIGCAHHSHMSPVEKACFETSGHLSTLSWDAFTAEQQSYLDRGEMYWRMQERFDALCKSESWPQPVLDCFNAATVPDDANACVAQMTPDQVTHLGLVKEGAAFDTRQHMNARSAPPADDTSPSTPPSDGDGDGDD